MDFITDICIELSDILRKRLLSLAWRSILRSEKCHFTYLVLHILHLVLHISFTKVFCEGNPRMEFFPYAVLKCHAFLVIFLVGQQRKQLKF